MDEEIMSLEQLDEMLGIDEGLTVADDIVRELKGLRRDNAALQKQVELLRNPTARTVDAAAELGEAYHRGDMSFEEFKEKLKARYSPRDITRSTIERDPTFPTIQQEIESEGALDLSERDVQARYASGTWSAKKLEAWTVLKMASGKAKREAEAKKPVKVTAEGKSSEELSKLIGRFAEYSPGQAGEAVARGEWDHTFFHAWTRWKYADARDPITGQPPGTRIVATDPSIADMLAERRQD